MASRVPIAGAGAAERKEEPSRAIEYLDRVEEGIVDIDVPPAVNGRPLWAVHVPRGIPCRAELAYRLPIRRKDLDPIIEGVRHVHQPLLRRWKCPWGD